MDPIKTIKGYIVEVALGKISEKIDGRNITRNLEKAIDAQLGEKCSEKIQRGPVWEFIKELAEGLYEDDKLALRLNLVEWARDLKYNERGN